MIPASKLTPRYRCARFLPIHGENFGGFFLAALTKVAEAPGIEAVPRSELITLEEMPVAWSVVCFHVSRVFFWRKTVGGTPAGKRSQNPISAKSLAESQGFLETGGGYPVWWDMDLRY